MNFDFKDIMKNIGALKEQMETIRKRVSKMKITGEAGAGMVKVTVNGEGKVMGVDIEPGLLSGENKEMLEELVISATNDALARSREALSHEMKGMTGGIPIPGIEKLFGG